MSMGMTSTTINSKHVFLSLPYDLDVRHREPLVGHEKVIRTILAAWRVGMAPLLVGPPGVGKNHIVYEVARITGRRLWILQGHENVTADDIACTARFSDDPERKFDYTLSPIATAMIAGGIAFHDEIGKDRPQALAPLAPALDERHYLDSLLLGERIAAHAGFFFIAATNSVDLAAEGLPDFIRSRLQPVIRVGIPDRCQIATIVRNRFAHLGGNDALIALFWRLWDAHRSDSMPSPRETLHAFALAMGLADHEAGQSDGGSETVLPRHLEEAFEKLFVVERAVA